MVKPGVQEHVVLEQRLDMLFPVVVFAKDGGCPGVKPTSVPLPLPDFSIVVLVRQKSLG
jgi:hypothetical protein